MERENFHVQSILPVNLIHFDVDVELKIFALNLCPDVYRGKSQVAKVQALSSKQKVILIKNRGFEKNKNK